MHGHRKGLDKEVGVGKVGAHLGDLRDDVKENDDIDDIDEADDAVTIILVIMISDLRVCVPEPDLG